MAVKTFTTGEVLTAADTNTYLANSGLVFVKSQTIGSGVGSVVVTDAFNSTYDNYRVIINGTANSINTANAYIQFANTPNHFGTFAYNFYTAGTLSFDNPNASTRMSIGILSNVISNFVFDIMNPNKTTQTFVTGTHYSAGYGGFHAAEYSLTTSFTSFTFLPSTGLLSGGTITVYGYRKA